MMCDMLCCLLATEADAMWSTIFGAMTAVGTVGACIISLALAFDRSKHKLDCVFVWGVPNDYKPTLLVNNLCNRTIVISRISVTYARKSVAVFDFLEDCNMKENAIIPAGTEKTILFNADKFHFSDLKLLESDEAQKQKKKTLAIVVHTSSGKRFVSKQKYSEDGVLNLLIGHEILGTD